MSNHWFDPDAQDLPRGERRFVRAATLLLMFVSGVMIALFAASRIYAASPFCDAVGNDTPISEGLNVEEYDNGRWGSVPSSVFVNAPYIIIPAPENGVYAIYRGIGEDIVVVPFENLDTGDDGWQHNTCGYVIRWTR